MGANDDLFTTSQSNGSDDVHKKLMEIIDPQEKSSEEIAAEEKAAKDLANEGKTAEEIAAEEIAAEEIAAEEKAAKDLANEGKTPEEIAAEEKAAKDLANEGKTPEEIAAEEKAAKEKTALEEGEEFEIEASQFAGLLGIDESTLLIEEDGTVSFQTKVDGEVGKVALSDLIKSHQTEAHVTKKSQAHADKVKEFDTQMAQAAEVVKGRIGEIAAVSRILEQQLTSEFNSINWDQLRIDNPSEWSAKRTEFQDRVNTLNTAKQNVAGILMKQVQDHQVKVATDLEARMVVESEALRAAIPSWNDTKVAEAEFTDLSKFLRDTYGFEENDIGSVQDHRLFLMARDAKQFRKDQKISKEVVKKIVKLPKFTKTSGITAQGTAAGSAAHQKKRVRLKSTGSIKDTANVLLDIIS
jgi:hypothetical protein